MYDVPFASLARKLSTLETVRLNAATVNPVVNGPGYGQPWSAMLRMS